jgi:cellulose synthase/poly-beta-1,6-N-acetylglucosamine synthase-like glycosyltransferase
MTAPARHLHAPSLPHQMARHPRPLGRALFEAGLISALQLRRALDRQAKVSAPLGEILVSDGLASQKDIARILAQQHGLHMADLLADPPQPDLSWLADYDIWLRHRAVPWMHLGAAVFVACARPDRLSALKADLPEGFPPVVPVVAPEEDVLNALAALYKPQLTARAEARVAPRYSCRTWRKTSRRRLAALALPVLMLTSALVLFPKTVFIALCILAISSLFLITGLKIIGALAQIGQAPHARSALPDSPQMRWPRISILVPLFRETEIAEALVTRLQRLTYPKVCLDVILVLEQTDTLTRDTLAQCDLPGWMRVVEVPDSGGVTTKPRALNYALDFCRGDIIGIWDAEDAPAPDQLQHVASHFARASPEVVCLQGILDYYNPRANWIARCFTLEYSSWFRVVLPGLARLGLAIPLGGTTLFLRREAIHEMGGWDAHNVTEDADLGMRIARFGYKTEIIRTTTFEEANCRPWRWVKQRSRWLKGFMVTYLVHMRRPRQLLAEIGWKKFLGFQAFFIGTLSQFLLAPILWTFWLKMLAAPHVTTSVFPASLLITITALFMLTELVNLSVAMWSVARPERRYLMPWALTMPLYFPLGTLAAYKALWELLTDPFYWDKTQHGHSPPELTARKIPV